MPQLGHDNPRDRRRRKAFLELRPSNAIIDRVVEPVASAGEQHAAAIRVLGQRHRVRQRMILRQAVADLLPALTEIGGLVDERLAIVHQVQIDDHVGRARIEDGRLDLPHRAPGRQARDVPGDVVPLRAGITGVPHLTVVGAGPDQPALNRRRRDRKHQLAVELTEVVADDAARGDDAAGIVG